MIKLRSMHRISKDSPAYFLTIVAKDRLPVFRTEKVKLITCKAMDEARKSGKFAIYAYVIMPNHIHLISDSYLKPSETLRYVKGIMARRVIDYLKKGGFQKSLDKLRTETKGRNYKHTLWEHHSNTFLVTHDAMMRQKVNYIHQNPVNDGHCERAVDYHFSSSRFWFNLSLINEPLDVDIKEIKWSGA